MIIQERLLKIIRDDNYAAGFQSLGQYRTALLQAARGAGADPAPHPAEQQPAPDVAGLVEALGRALDFIRGDGDFEHREALERCECYACVTGEIIDSLAAHRKQGGEA